MDAQRVLEAGSGRMLEPKWISRYSNQQRILLVGEGNFSFSSCLATAFGAATNMVATSLDSRGALLQKYGMEAEFNTFSLSQRGARVFHDFDACKMAKQHKNLLRGIQMSYFDCIVFNFPHAGFLGREDDAHVMKKHKKLVRLFFANARHMLLPGGQVHVSHKLGHPYKEWKLKEQGEASGLRLVERVSFHREHFPGYRNCRGDGCGAGEIFHLGQADTYIFAARIEEPPASSLNVRERLRMSSTVLALSNEPPATTLNVGEPVGIRSTITMLANVKSLKRKAVYKAGASQGTSLQQVVADEVTRLEKLRLGKTKMKMILMPLKSALQRMNLENSTNVKDNSQNIGCTESTLPPFSPQPKLEDMETSDSEELNEESVGCPKLEDMETSDSEELNEESVGCPTVLSKLWEVLWRHSQRI